MTNAITKADDDTRDRFRLRATANHDPCLLSFRCLTSPDDELDDKTLFKKGILSFLDAFVDPMAGTRYVICVHPPIPKSTGSYFQKAGKHIAWVMHSAEGDEIARGGRRATKR